MAKQKQIDATAGRMGAMLRSARQMCHMSTDDAALLLRIMPDELAAYERGISKMPTGVLEHMFIMGYKMMQVRIIERRYNDQCAMLKKLKQICTDTK